MGLFSGNKEIKMTPSQLVSLLEYLEKGDFTLREVKDSKKKKVKSLFDKVRSGKSSVNIVDSSDDVSKVSGKDLYRDHETESIYSFIADVEFGNNYLSEDLVERLKSKPDMRDLASSKGLNPEQYDSKEKWMRMKYFRFLSS